MLIKCYGYRSVPGTSPSLSFALQRVLWAQASFTRPIWPVTTWMPQNPPSSSQGCYFPVSSLEHFQRHLRELLLKDYSYLLDLHSLTRKERCSSIQGSSAHRAILTQLRCRHCSSNLAAAAGFLIIDMFQKTIVISSLSSQTWWQVVLNRLTRMKLFSGGQQLQAVMHIEVIILIMTSVNTVLDCNQSLYSIRTIAIKQFQHQK